MQRDIFQFTFLNLLSPVLQLQRLFKFSFWQFYLENLSIQHGAYDVMPAYKFTHSSLFFFLLLSGAIWYSEKENGKRTTCRYKNNVSWALRCCGNVQIMVEHNLGYYWTQVSELYYSQAANRRSKSEKVRAFHRLRQEILLSQNVLAYSDYEHRYIHSSVIIQATAEAQAVIDYAIPYPSDLTYKNG